jgi:hypothetical protein
MHFIANVVANDCDGITRSVIDQTSIFQVMF